MSARLSGRPHNSPLNIHRQNSLADAFGIAVATGVWNRFTIHYTTTHVSWLNQAEIKIGLFARQCLGKRRISELTQLKRQTRTWNRRMNRNRGPINRQFGLRAARLTFGYKWNSFKRVEELATQTRLSHEMRQFFVRNKKRLIAVATNRMWNSITLNAVPRRSGMILNLGEL